MASRRAISLTSTLLRRHHHRHHTFHRRPAAVSSLLSTFFSSSSPQNPTQNPSRSFHSTATSPLSARPLNDGDKIDADTILFEGCDYKHWLIVMDFPNDPQQRPPPEEMVETYVQTLAKIVGSVEEAKKKMYACSTTTYTGFQAEIDEATSEKFEGMPGVLFVLPDSYIDPVNKEYGGDKYINGTIIPRPPPVQYGRVRRGNRFNEQRPRDPMPDQQGNPSYNQRPGDGRGYMPQQSSAQQQGFPPQQGQQGYSQQQGFPPQQGQQSYAQQQGFPPRQGYPQQQGFSSQQGVPPRQGYPQQGFPPQQRIHAQQNYGPPSGGRDSYQSGGSNYMPSRPGNQNNEYNQPQGQMEIHPRDQRGYGPQGQMGSDGPNRNHNTPPTATGAYGQTMVETFNHGAEAGYGQGYRPDGPNQRSTQITDDHSNTIPSEHRSYPPTGHAGMNQGRN